MNAEYFSVGATQRFDKPERDNMFTREQLAAKWEEAQKCAKCPYPDDCHICPYDIIEENPEIVNKFKGLHQKGATDYSLGRQLGMCIETVAAMRVVLGLPKNKKKSYKAPVPTKNPCETCFSRDICKKHKGTCNARVRWEESVSL